LPEDWTGQLPANYWYVWSNLGMMCIQWPFQDPKLEVPTIYKAYIRPM
jgi:hypothetical protein